jgi:endoglycosylceramidase
VGLEDHYAAAWRRVAHRFAGAAYVLGYDLFNEPWPGSAWPTCVNPAGCPLFDSTALTSFVTRTIAAIRKADPTTLAFYEPLVTFDFGASTSLADTGDPNAAMSFHDYCLPAGLGAGTLPAQGSGCRLEENLPFANADAHAAKTGDALLLTEFGATDDLDTLTRVTDLADQHMVGWQEWHYCACGEPTSQVSGDQQSLVLDPRKPPRGSNVKTAKLRTLDRPYPQAIAGTPTAYRYEPSTDRFTLAYSIRAPSGKRLPRSVKSVVYVPRSHYPHGYAVEVSGARVVSPAGARYLVLERKPGARSVTLAIGPGR